MRVTKDDFALLENAFDVVSSSKAAVELEARVTRALSVAEFHTVVRGLSAKGFRRAEDATELDLVQDSLRCTLKDQESIRTYLASRNFGKDVKAVVMKKQAVVPPVEFPDYDYRVNVKSEAPIKLTPAEFVQQAPNATMRLKNRASFLPVESSSASGHKFRVDCTIVKQKTSDRGDFQKVFEVEIEYLPDKSVDKSVDQKKSKDLALELLNKMNALLKVLQQTSYPMGKEETAAALGAYAALVSKQQESKDSQTPFVGPKPVSLTLGCLRGPGPGVDSILQEYTVTDKADGLRHLLFVDAGGKVFTLDDRMAVKFTGLSNPALSNSLFDGELVHTKSNRKRFACFDAYFIKGLDVRSLPLMSDNVGSQAKAKGAGFAAKGGAAKAKANAEDLTRLDVMQSAAQDFAKSKKSSESDLDFAVKEYHYIGSPADLHAACLTYKKKFELVGGVMFDYDVDGLIFTPARLAVGADAGNAMPARPGGTWRLAFKWKPAEMSTIDFQVKLAPSECRVAKDGSMEMRAHLLVAGATPVTTMDVLKGIVPNATGSNGFQAPTSSNAKVEFDPTRESPAYLRLRDARSTRVFCENGDEIANDAIVEFYYDSKSGGGAWRPMRVRYDKVRPNHLSTAESVWHTIRYPVTLGHLTGADEVDPAVASIAPQYYDASKKGDASSRGMRSFHNYWVKYRTLLAPLKAKGCRSLFDLACGRGGDVRKWVDVGLTQVLGIDVVRDNLTNPTPGNPGANKRALDAGATAPPNVCKMLFLPMDASRPFAESTLEALADPTDRLVARIAWGILPKEQVKMPCLHAWHGIAAGNFDAASCMFALHYFFRDAETLATLIRNVDSVLKPGGFFVGVCLDGRAVHDELEKVPYGDGIGARSDSDYTWHITRLYEEYAPLGCTIRVYNGNIGIAQDEYLVDFEFFVAEMSRAGMELVSKQVARSMGVQSGTGLLREVFEYFTNQQQNAAADARKIEMTNAEKEYSFCNRYFIFQKAAAAAGARAVQK